MDALPRRLHDAGEQRREARRHPLDRLRAEQLLFVPPGERQPLRAIHHVELEIELRGADRATDPLEACPAEPHIPQRRVLQHEHDLEQRTVAQTALRPQLLDQHLERRVLMRVGVQDHPTARFQQVDEPRIAGQVASQHQRVDQETDQRLEVAMHAARDRRAHHDILFIAVPAQEDRERRLQKHEQRHTALPAEGLDPVPQPATQYLDVLAPFKALARRPWPVERQRMDPWQPGELALPVAQLTFEHLAVQPLPLPVGIVPVLHAQRLQRVLPALPVRRVENVELVHQHAHRPAVRHDVVHVEQHPMLRVGKP